VVRSEGAGGEPPHAYIALPPLVTCIIMSSLKSLAKRVQPPGIAFRANDRVLYSEKAAFHGGEVV
jgi:hypothetical protein